MGIEFSDCILTERNHRYNQRMSESKRDNYPKFGHYDSWMIDLLQMLVLENHNVHLYPEWSNTMEFADANESFGTIALHNKNLHEVIENLNLDCNDIKLTSYQKHIAKSMGIKLPFLPVITIEERKLFNSLCTACGMNVSLILNEWNKHINGKTIFPKLEVYLRTHLEKWKKNKRIEACVSSSQVGIDRLRTLFQFTAPAKENDNNANETSQNNNANDEIDAYWQNSILENEQSPHSTTIDLTERQSQVIGGLCIGPATIMNAAVITKALRGKDRRPRKKRECSWCKLHNTNKSYECKGRGGLSHCEYKNREN